MLNRHRTEATKLNQNYNRNQSQRTFFSFKKVATSAQSREDYARGIQGSL